MLVDEMLYKMKEGNMRTRGHRCKFRASASKSRLGIKNLASKHLKAER
jgi:hypothetical protein